MVVHGTDFTAAVNASHAANRRTLKIVVTLAAPPSLPLPTPSLPMSIPIPVAAKTAPPLPLPVVPSSISLATTPPTSAILFTPKPPVGTPPVVVVTQTSATPTLLPTIATPTAPSSSPVVATAATPTSVAVTSPVSTTSSTPSTPSQSIAISQSIDPTSATAGEPITRGISSSIPPKWRHVIDVIPRFALSNDNSITNTAPTPTSANGTTSSKPLETKSTDATPDADAASSTTTPLQASSLAGVSVPDMTRTRSAQDDWEEVAAIGQWSALERGIRSIRPDVITWLSATLLPSPADPKVSRYQPLLLCLQYDD
jgi:hypothetical protein